MTAGPIVSAKDTLLSQNPGTLPDVSGALLNWFQPLTFRRITKSTIGFQVVETFEDVFTEGIIQPFTAQQLQIKPEGQRAWKWFTIHAAPGCPLEPDDVITVVNVKDGNTSYRVMSKRNFSAYGYLQYEVVEDYEGGS
jgi:hypothetical protein